MAAFSTKQIYIIEQDFVRAGLDKKGWEPGEIGIHGRGQGIAGVGACKICIPDGMKAFGRYPVKIAVPCHGISRKQHVNGWRHCYDPPRKRQPLIPGIQGQSERKRSTSRDSGRNYLPRVIPLIYKEPVPGNRIKESCREMVFGCEAVID
jgi:hypothetical protein